MHNCSQKKKLVLHCSQENGYGALLFSGERNRCTTVLKEKETGALLFSVKGKRCSIVFKRIKQGHYCSQGEGTWCSTAHVFRRRGLLFYSFQEKGTYALSTTVLRIGEGNKCSTVFRRDNRYNTVPKRRKLVLYCFQENKSGAPSYPQEKGSGALPFSKRRRLVHYCSQKKGKWCTSVIRRREQVLYCF